MKLRRNQYLIHDMFDDGAALCGLVSMAEHAHNPQCPLDWKREPAFASIWWVAEAEEIMKAYLIWHSGLEELLALRDKEMDDPFGNHYILREPISYAFASAWERSD